MSCNIYFQRTHLPTETRNVFKDITDNFSPQIDEKSPPANFPPGCYLLFNIYPWYAGNASYFYSEDSHHLGQTPRKKAVRFVLSCCSHLFSRCDLQVMLLEPGSNSATIIKEV